MRRTLTICRNGLAGVAAVALLAACGGNDSTDSASSSSSSSAETTSSSSSSSSAGAADSDFCQQASVLVEGVANANTEDPSTLGPLLQQVASGIEAIDPPSEIASDWTTFGTGVQQLGDALAQVDFSDPTAAAAAEQTLSQIESQFATAATNVDTYLTNECGIDTGDTDTSTPTS